MLNRDCEQYDCANSYQVVGQTGCICTLNSGTSCRVSNILGKTRQASHKWGGYGAGARLGTRVKSHDPDQTD